MMQYYSNPQMNAVMQGGMGMGMGANQGMMGQNPMLGMQGMASYGQAWRNLASLVSGQCEGGADGSSRVMIIPLQVLLTSPKPPGELGILYVSRFISKSRSTTHTTIQAKAQYNGGRLERSFFDNIVRLCREYESSPTAVTHKTNVHSSDPTA